MGSIDGDPVEVQRVTSGSLIDLSIDPEPPGAAAVSQTRQANPSIDGDNGASFISSATEKASHAPPANSLESLLFELSVPMAVPAGNMPEVPSSGDAPSTAPVGNMLTLPAGGVSPAEPLDLMSALPNSDGASIIKSTTNVPTPPPIGGAPAAAPLGVPPVLPNSDGDSIVKVADGQQLPSMQQHQPSASPAAYSISTAQQTTPSVEDLNNQLWTSSLASNGQEPSSSSAEQSSQAILKPAQDASSGVGPQPLPVEAKSSGRQELPVDLFTASYSSVPAPVPGWQTGPPHGMGYGMQYYPTTLPVPAFPNAAKSSNPFDLSNETVQAPTFPYIPSLQGALPNVSSPTGIMRTSSTHYPQSMPPQSASYSSAMLPQSPSYGTNKAPSSYMGQQVSNNMPPSRTQEFGSFGNGGADFGSLNSNPQLTGRYSAPTTPNSFSSMGGNPFG